MTESTQDSAENYAIALLVHYCFELGGYRAEEVVAQWFANYPASWVRLAIIEALYQGRYKAVSVEQILGVWHRRNAALFHFNHEFERLVCRKFPQTPTERFLLESVTTSYPIEPENLQELDEEESEFLEETLMDEAEPAEETDSIELTVSATLSEKITSMAEVYYDVLPELSVNPERPVEVDNFPSAEDEEPLETAIYRPHYPIAYEANWARYELSKRPIHQFIPPKDNSEFYLKLKAVAEHQEDSASNEEVGSR